MNLINLHCKRCFSPLEGDNNSQVFFCLKCHLSFNLETNGLISFPIFFQKAQIQFPEKKGFYFPFWYLRTSWKSNQNNQPAPFNCWVSAFFIRNINNLGDIGQFYTSRQVPLITDEKQNYPLTVADRNLNIALKYPEIYLYLQQRTADNFAELKLSVEIEEIRMVLVPFFLQENKLYDSQLNCQYPRGALI